MYHTTRLPWLSERLRSVVTVHAPTLGRTGTGFVVSADGHLLTAAHCVVDDSRVPAGGEHEPEEDITAVFHDGCTYSVQLVGFDMHADVAVLRLPPDVRVPPPIPVRRHTYPRPGDACVVVGNVFGQDPRSVAIGAVRNGRWKDPHGLSLLSTVLTDVATGAGTSGGPILDAAGHVVALHTAAYGARPHVCSHCDRMFSSAVDLQLHRVTTGSYAYTVDAPGVEPPKCTTQLGGGVASPVLWRIYLAILSSGRDVLTRSTLPCTVIPCVPANLHRIRNALGDQAWWPTTSGYCVIRSEDQRLRAGDVIIRTNSTCVAVESSLHDAVWLLVPGTTCVVHVRRRTDSVKVPGVELVGFDSGQDVAVGQVQATVATSLKKSFVFTRCTIITDKNKTKTEVWYRHKSPHEWTLAFEYDHSTSTEHFFTIKKNSILEVDVMIKPDIDHTQWEGVCVRFKIGADCPIKFRVVRNKPTGYEAMNMITDFIRTCFDKFNGKFQLREWPKITVAIQGGAITIVSS